MNNSCLGQMNIALFSGLCCGELSELLDCINARTAHYEKGSHLLLAGDMLVSIGIVLEGQAAVYKTDISGNRTLLASLGPSQLYGEALLCAGISESPVSVEALSDVTVLLIPFERITGRCIKGCEYHNQLIKNLMRIVAQKALALTEKLNHISQKTTRQKLASYLLAEASHHGSQRFDIAYDRQALADYLSVNRSALSRELSHIAGKGIVSYHKNSFFIRDAERLEQILEGE